MKTSIGSMVSLTFVMAVSKGFAEVEVPWGWFFLVVIAGIFFLIPFLLVHGIASLIRGFREPSTQEEWVPTEKTIAIIAIITAISQS